MNFGLTIEEETFRKEVSDFLDKELTYEISRQGAMDKGVGPEGRAFGLKLGAKGWLGLSWPKEYGGKEFPLTYEYILVSEFGRHDAHIPVEIAVFMAGPIILHTGSEELKQEFLPRIVRGEVEFGLGYTEPQAGSDLAAMTMLAVEDGDDYIINGQKTFNTEAHYADYHWLAVKTDTSGAPHKSISLFVVDQRSPGITIRPIWTLGGERSNEVFYDNVRVPKRRLVGEKGKGFFYMLGALNYERLMLIQAERYISILDNLVEFTKETRRNGRLLAEDPIVRHKLAQLAIEVEVGRCLEFRGFGVLFEGNEPDYESGIVKIFLSEMEQHFANTAMEILGPYGRLEEGSKWAPMRGKIEHLCRFSVVETIGGGTSEVLRNLTATRGLGLPRR